MSLNTISGTNFEGLEGNLVSPGLSDQVVVVLEKCG